LDIFFNLVSLFARGYSFTQSLIPSEKYRIISNFAPNHPFVQNLANQCSSFEDCEKIIDKVIVYRLSIEVWGKECIPTIDQLITTEKNGIYFGDCKTQAVLLRSILKSKGYKFKVRTNYQHVWIEKEN